jgi:hypothetical protein
MKVHTSLCLVAISLLVASLGAFAQKKPDSWTEWSKRDAEKMLTSSPWAQTQVETDLTEMFYVPTSPRGGAPNAASRAEQGATNQEVNLQFHIRFFSARPIRQALARLYQIQQKPTEEELKGLNEFATAVPSNVIIVAVTYESTDKRALGRILQLFGTAITATLKNKVYLERKDGGRLFLQEYVPPGRDGFGARFVFPRFVDERPFIKEDTGEVRFYAEFKDNVKLNMRFSVAQMMYNDRLEY